ncbi:hypothetical protein GGI07_004905 [Coemansia sp. Benny D115]|nr:hypothetical protein GGI07_004905 [Coemansia sp. Benny D115]
MTEIRPCELLPALNTNVQQQTKTQSQSQSQPGSAATTQHTDAHTHDHAHDHAHGHHHHHHHHKTSETGSSSRSSVVDSLGGENGRTPFGFPIGSGDQTAATFLAQCYEQLMKDTASTHSASQIDPAIIADVMGGGSATAAITQMLKSQQSFDEPLTYVFIFTNPRSGNQQGRSLMNLAFRNFRLRDRPDVQVQIYDVTDKESQREGLHFLHQLQLRQGDRLLRTAFPELFVEKPGHTCLRPSPKMCMGTKCGKAKCSRVNNSATSCEANAGGSTPQTPGSPANSESSNAWEEWISEAAAQLEGGLSAFSEEELTARLEMAQESAIKLHVWSAGGDGTVSATLQAMMDYGIDVGRLYFSCIPFGTGNDFSDALGWGRSVPGDAVGESMRLLNKTITERLDGYTSKLDIYEITITTYDDGHIKHVEKDMFSKPGMKRYTCLMIDYFSLGVQGFVGSSFEMHRPGKRALNILMYTAAAAKWVFMKKFPPINEALESISTVPEAIMNDPKMSDADRAQWLEAASEAERKQILLARVAGPRKRSHGRKMSWTKEPKAQRNATARDFGEGVDIDVPVIQHKPIEIDIQNVARFWGRDIDVWSNAREEDDKDVLSNRMGVTDSKNWTPQYAGDGKVELFGVRDIGDYALNQIPGRKDYRIDRLAQMVTPLALHFRAPEDYPPRSRNPLTNHKNIEQGLLFSMCDGEFIEMYHPKDIIVSRKVTLKAVGRSPESSRIVLDTIKNDGLDAVQMDATAAANKMRSGETPDVSNYVASPFQRIFRLGRSSANVSRGDLAGNDADGSMLDPRSPVLSRNDSHLAAGGKSSSRPGSIRRSTFSALRNTIFRSSRSSTATAPAKDTSHSDGLLRSSTIGSPGHSLSSDVESAPPVMRNTQSSSLVTTTSSALNKAPSPKKRLSMIDITETIVTSPSPELDADKLATVPHAAPIYPARSRSVDFGNIRTVDAANKDGLAAAAADSGVVANGILPVPKHKNRPQDSSQSLHSTHSDLNEPHYHQPYSPRLSDSESESENDLSSTSVTTGAGSSTTGVDLTRIHSHESDGHDHQHCLLTLGKQLVNTFDHEHASLPAKLPDSSSSTKNDAALASQLVTATKDASAST